jgi:hypothetical protein
MLRCCGCLACCCCRSMRAHVVQPLSAMPGEPGGAELAAAVSTLGLQTWVSPLHIWHLLSGQSRGADVACYGCWQQPDVCLVAHLLPFALLLAVEKAVRAMFSYLERSRSMMDGGISDSAAASAEAAATAAAAEEAAAGATADPYEQQQAAAPPLVRPRSPKLLLSVGVSQVSLLWLVSCAELPARNLLLCTAANPCLHYISIALPDCLIFRLPDRSTAFHPLPDRHLDAQGRRSQHPWQRRRYGGGWHLVPPRLGHQRQA